ncbi:hypothetical protein FuraDRAFT_1807 [Pseudogulbenkiania ferrooxidans 2002]|uniref:Uncharacterized protein n=1 Tax=Pseudogulbenkiania ferrooxidans 2002 TaxID=279714 RepID=B9Z394_9NEIS|nr:hypothetical protein FuraDRAFT_1807 [Pseudogulbenkiania ferrooxidans 2002]
MIILPKELSMEFIEHDIPASPATLPPGTPYRYAPAARESLL